MPNHESHWQQMWGARYDHADLKEQSVRPVMEGLDLPDDSLAVDYGCGAFPTSMMVPEDSNPGFRAIGVDLVASRLADQWDFGSYNGDQGRTVDSDRMILMRGDVDAMARGTPDGRPDKKALRALLVEHSRDGEPKADLAVLSDILNYVHHQKVMKMTGYFLRKSGVVVVVNQPFRGDGDAFSPDGVHHDDEILAAMDANGIEVEDMQYGETIYSLQPDVAIIVGRKS